MKLSQVVCVAGLFLCGCATTASSVPTTTGASEPPPPAVDSSGLTPERIEGIERVFVRRVPELNRCWVEESERSRNTKLQGDLKVSFVVDEKGRVRETKILDSTFESKGLQSCITGRLSAWVFPEGRGEVPVVRSIHLGPDT